jgi:aminoglycoside phosphotransferase (APT) family kinase protein
MTSATTLVETFAERADEAARRQPLWDYVQACGLRSLVVGASKNPNAKITILLVSPTGRPVLAIKVPTTEAAAGTVQREARVLGKLRRLGLGLATTIPRVVDSVDFNGLTALVMTAVEGTPMSTEYLRWRYTARRAAVAAHFDAAAGWLADLQRETAGETARLEMDAGVAARLSSRFCEDRQVATDLEALAAIHARLRRDVVPRTAVHGDFWLANVLLTRGRVSGVVDWEDADTAGEPVRDVVRFALMYALFLDRRTRPGRNVPGHRGLYAAEWGAGIRYAIDGAGWFPELFSGFLRDGLGRLGASPAGWRDAALAGIAEVAALTDDDVFARRHLELFRALVGREARLA